jgi:branched-chain amino acid transport system ATP-binding protein
MLFGPMSVRENLELGAYGAGRKRRSASAEALGTVHALFPVLEERSSQPAETLSGGEQQMLAVARALMSRPRLLLLDEPSLGLAPKVIGEIFAALDALRAQGVTILLVEQDARLALKHADRGYVMRTGRVVLEGSAGDLLADETVRTIYLGAWRGEGEGS